VFDNSCYRSGYLGSFLEMEVSFSRLKVILEGSELVPIGQMEEADLGEKCETRGQKQERPKGAKPVGSFGAAPSLQRYHKWI
jgi:hypothetical protein